MSCLRDSICQSDPSLQELIEAIVNASSLTLLVLLVEEALTQRAQLPTQWSCCPKCGKRLRGKGFIPRQINSIIGVIFWERRVGRCPDGCAIGRTFR